MHGFRSQQICYEALHNSTVTWESVLLYSIIELENLMKF